MESSVATLGSQFRFHGNIGLIMFRTYNYSQTTVHTGKWSINGLTALSRLTVNAIFALPNIVCSEEVCDATKASTRFLSRAHKNTYLPIS